MTLRTIPALFAASLLVGLPVAAGQAQGHYPMADIEFQTLSHDFGKIASGRKGTGVLKFTSTGSEKLILTDVKSNCSCLTVNWPKAPVLAGKSGEITFTYDATKVGKFRYRIAVSSNSTITPVVALTINGEVTAANGKPGAKGSAPGMAK